MSVSEALENALSGLELKDSDKAAVELARVYAAEIDRPETDHLTKVGPAFLSCLEALGMTPKARVALAGKEGSSEPAKSPLDELRARREARQNGA